RLARRSHLWPMGLPSKLPSASRRVWRAEVPYGNRSLAPRRRSPDRGYIRRTLPERRAWLRLFDVMGPCFRHILVVSWPSNPFPSRWAVAAELVGRPGQSDVWFAGGLHPIWTAARRHLCGFRPPVVAVVYPLRSAEPRSGGTRPPFHSI